MRLNRFTDKQIIVSKLPALNKYILNPVFEIIPEAIFFRETNLICEISPDGFSYVFENDVEKKFHGLSVFYFNDGTGIEAQLKTIYNEQPLLRKEYKKVFVSYSGGESAMLPEELYKPGENEPLLNMLYGDLQPGNVAADVVANKKVYNVYRVSSEIHKVLVDMFPLAVFNHHNSLLIKQDIPGDLLHVIFYKNTFLAILIKGGFLQIIQTYLYNSGADVIYYMENIRRQFNMVNIPVRAGGKIEEGSDLHKELHHHYPGMVFTELPAEYTYADSLKKLPPHYFSHLFSLARCV